MKNMLKDQVAVVTGGSRGIGRAVVEELAGLGCRVAFSYVSRDKDALSLQNEWESKGGAVWAKKVDVKDFSAVKSWVEEVKERWGRLDILVNNAGIIRDKALMLMDPQEWQEVIDTDLTGMFNASRAVIVTFLKQKRGRIINISSVSGVTGLPRQTNYSAAKGGMNAFTKSLAKEVAGYGVLVNAVAPGFIETEILSGLSDEQRGVILGRIPLGRLGQTSDVARCVKFLLSEEASYITGQVIQVDGGLAIR